MRVLFVRFSSLGDVVLTTGAIKKFKEFFPDAQADVLTYSSFADVFGGLDFIGRVITYDKRTGLKGYFGLVQKELDEYDHIFDLHGKALSMLLRFASPADYHRYVKDSAARRSFVKTGKTSERLMLHVTQKYFEPVAEAFGLEMPSIEELRPVMPAGAEQIKGRILIHPFASKYTKTYPYMRELAELLVKEGFTPVFAGDGDAPKVEGAVYKTGKTSLKELFVAVSSAEAVISTDSGPLHIACAMNKPTVAVFGSTTKEFGFYPGYEHTKVIENKELSCRPCHVHGLDSCPKGHFDCMTKITQESVLEALKSVLI